jgi:hypothetical protein
MKGGFDNKNCVTATGWNAARFDVSRHHLPQDALIVAMQFSRFFNLVQRLIGTSLRPIARHLHIQRSGAIFRVISFEEAGITLKVGSKCMAVVRRSL